MQTLQQPRREFYVPPSTQVIFVQDFFVSELIGGAELTSDAIIQACPYKLFQMHSHSVTESIVLKNREKVWVFGNQVGVAPWLLDLFRQHNIEYYFFEYDFKPCIYRSVKKHEISAGKPCDCHLNDYGKFQALWMSNAQKIFWCSNGQKDQFYRIYPELLDGRDPGRDVIQWSTFYPESILKMRALREARQRGEVEVQDRWIVLDSDSWIKGTEASVKYCRENNMNFQLVKGVSNDEFLKLLNTSKGMVFLPADIDVGSRTCQECLLTGAEPITNNNVLPVHEVLYRSGNLVELEHWHLDGPARFWRNVEG